MKTTRKRSTTTKKKPGGAYGGQKAKMKQLKGVMGEIRRTRKAQSKK